MQKLIECVPNFSEGRDQNVIREITDAIKSVDGVSLLDVDPGASTNRTVVTFVGSPDAAVEAAFRGIKKAAELIDMRKHKGAHPRMGATDVCPFIPVSNVNWEEAIDCANRLAKRVGDELKIPVYLYEKAAKNKSRSNLSVIRVGEYEGFFEKIRQPEWKPDFGPAVFNEKSGATVIGVRDFLVAYNVNLNTKSVRRANSVAFDVREQGRVQTEDGTPWRKTGAGCEWRADSSSRNAEARQGDWLVRERIWHRSGVDEPDQYRRNAATRGVRCVLRIRSQTRPARHRLGDRRHGSEEMSR